MSITPTKDQSSSAAIGAVFLTLGIAMPTTAATFNPVPLFDEVNIFTASIPASGDLADVYFPTLPTSSSNNDSLPIALFLQGANVDKSEYSAFASIVASYGFAVVAPNHRSDVFAPFGLPEGLFAEQGQVNDVLNFARSENSNPNSPVNGILDPNKLVLLGHSFGGIVGLNAIEGSCNFPTCLDEFNRSPELLGGAFYASALSQGNLEGITPPLNNSNIPVALLAGDRDGVTPLPLIEETFSQIQQPPKSLITINGANHFGITNRNNPPDTVSDPNSPILDQAVAIETIARWSSLFLRGRALGDEGALKYVKRTGDLLDPNVSVISQECDDDEQECDDDELEYVKRTGDVLDANVSVISQDVPEPSSILGLLSFGGIFLGFWRHRKIWRWFRLVLRLKA